MTASSANREPRHWLLLAHQLPPEPSTLRVRIWRRLQNLGASPLKNSVYILPDTDSALEDFIWLAKDIRAAGGDATVWRSAAVDGLSDADLVRQFRERSESEYAELASALEEALAGAPDDAGRALTRLRSRFLEVQSRDFFGAERHATTAALLDRLDQRLAGNTRVTADERSPAMKQYLNRTWVTRAHVHVDRMASAWLIRRYIDPEARFEFTADRAFRPEPGQLRFDMHEGEFTHLGERCTFEVLLDHFHLTDGKLRRIGEIIHDIDLKDSRYGHPETAGVVLAVNGIRERGPDDPARLEAAAGLFDSLLAGIPSSQ